jgi:Mrp family chromosome partitioning ATPase/uncharacterized protein involved in exopolysaccharide biosynthesis
MSDDQSSTPFVQPPGRVARASAPAAQDGDLRPGGIAVRRVLTAVRRLLLLLLLVRAFTTTLGLMVFRQPALYRAEAVLRVVGERSAVAPDMEPGERLDERHVVLVNSLVPRVRSRAVIGAVVDSLGLQVRPVPVFSLLRPPVLPTIALGGVRVGPMDKPDTLTLLFAPESLTVVHGDSSVKSVYGQPITLAAATLTVEKAPDMAGAVLAIDPRDLAIDRVLAQLAVVPMNGTDALDVRFVDTDPKRARDITNGIVRTFYASTINSSQEMARRRRLFLEAQLAEGDRQLGQAQSGLSVFRSRRRLASSSDKMARQQSELMTLETRNGELETDRRVFGSLLARLKTASDSLGPEQLDALAYSPEIATDPMVGKVFQQLLTYRSRLDSLTSGPFQSASTNPDVLQLQQMVKGTEGQLVRAVEGRLSSIDDRLAALRELRTRNADEIASMPMMEAEESRLGQKVSALADFSNQLRLEYQKARMSEALAATDIEIVDLAALPYLPTGIPWWFKVGLALVFGLLAGTLLSLLLEAKNRSIRAPEELEQALHLRGLGVIPPVMEAIAAEEALALGRGKNAGPYPALTGVVTDSPSCPSVGAEAFRLLYSSLTYGWGDRQRTILVTSVAPQEGKTLVAANLGVTFAREGARVLLVDCDLRRPRLHKMFRVGRAPGLVDLLRPRPAATLETEVVEVPRPHEHGYSMFPGLARSAEGGNGDVPAEAGSVPNGNGRKPVSHAITAPHPVQTRHNIRETGVRNLWLLPCGAVERTASETLKAGTFRALLAEVSTGFDVVILDTPPALASADAVILAPIADDVLLVIRAGHTDRIAAERTHQQLSDAGGNVVGAVLNDPEGKVARDQMSYYAYGYPVTSD